MPLTGLDFCFCVSWYSYIGSCWSVESALEVHSYLQAHKWLWNIAIFKWLWTQTSRLNAELLFPFSWNQYPENQIFRVMSSDLFLETQIVCLFCFRLLVCWCPVHTSVLNLLMFSLQTGWKQGCWKLQKMLAILKFSHGDEGWYCLSTVLDFRVYNGWRIQTPVTPHSLFWASE